MGVGAMFLISFGALVIALFLTALLIAVYVAIIGAMFSGAVGAPAALFAFFFAISGEHHLIVRIIIFFIVFIIISKTMEYKKLKYGMVAVISAANSVITCTLLGIIISCFGMISENLRFNIPDIVWLILGSFMAVILFVLAISKDDGEAKEVNVYIAKLGSSVLYGLAFALFAVQYLLLFIENYPNWLNPLLIIMFSICAYIVDTVLSRNEIDLIEKISKNEALQRILWIAEEVVGGGIYLVKGLFNR